MQYQEFLKLIYSKYSGNVKLELDRMGNLLEELGNPQNKLSGFHIAGTNGKGSTCAALEALCLAHGWHTGLNTSPHLIDYTERFRIDGRDLSFERILDEFLLLQASFERWEASFFEISTALAFKIFQDENVHSAVIEVGLGGRLDATNLFTPDVAAITTIGLDHVKTLGGTVELIAAEKAGIIKSGVPLVLGRIEESPLKVITDRAGELGVPAYILDRDFFVSVRSHDISGTTFAFRFGDWNFPDLKTNLLGEHQSANLAVAITCFILYAEARGLSISDSTIRKALLEINWKGRMQVLNASPVIIADGAHNVQGVQALLTTLDKIYPGMHFSFLISILADKDYAEMIRLICSRAKMIYIAQNESDRAASVEEQAEMVRESGVPYQTSSSVREAYALAVREMRFDEVLICGGSLYTVGEILADTLNEKI